MWFRTTSEVGFSRQRQKTCQQNRTKKQIDNGSVCLSPRNILLLVSYRLRVGFQASVPRQSSAKCTSGSSHRPCSNGSTSFLDQPCRNSCSIRRSSGDLGSRCRRRVALQAVVGNRSCKATVAVRCRPSLGGFSDRIPHPALRF